MERETIEKTIGKNKFVIKSYATAQETNDIQKVYFKNSKVDLVGKIPTIENVDTNIQFEVEKEMISQLVVSINEKTDGIVEDCLQLPQVDWSDIIVALDELTGKKKG